MAPAILYNTSFKEFATRNPICPHIGDLDFSAYERQRDLIEDIVESLKISGGCIIRGMYQKETLDAIEREIRPHIKATEKADSNRDNFVPSSTRMVTGLLSKSRSYALSVVGNQIWHEVSKYFLTSTLKNSWVRSTSSSSSRILLT
jgi:hypothetical protein